MVGPSSSGRIIPPGVVVCSLYSNPLSETGYVFGEFFLPFFEEGGSPFNLSEAAVRLFTFVTLTQSRSLKYNHNCLVSYLPATSII